MKRPSVLIIGYGKVGRAIHEEFPWADDTDITSDKTYPDNTWEYAFVCVPTDMKEDGTCDTAIVESVIREYSQRVKLFIIKSTVPPGTTDKLLAIFKESKIVFSPFHPKPNSMFKMLKKKYDIEKVFDKIKTLVNILKHSRRAPTDKLKDPLPMS